MLSIEAWHAFEQDVAICKLGDKEPVDEVALAHDDLGDRRAVRGSSGWLAVFFPEFRDSLGPDSSVIGWVGILETEDDSRESRWLSIG